VFLIAVLLVLSASWVASIREFTKRTQERRWLRSGMSALIPVTISFGFMTLVYFMKRLGMAPNHITVGLSYLFFYAMLLALLGLPLGFIARLWCSRLVIPALGLVMAYVWAVGVLASIAV